MIHIHAQLIDKHLLSAYYVLTHKQTQSSNWDPSSNWGLLLRTEPGAVLFKEYKPDELR